MKTKPAFQFPGLILMFSLLLLFISTGMRTDHAYRDSHFNGTGDPISPAKKARLDTIIRKHAETNHCRITARIVDTQGNAYQTGYDARKKEQITDFTGSIDIGSCSKIFTATAVLQLVEQGKFTLENRLVDLLPDRDLYGGLVKFEDKDYTEEVKLFHLLTHTSGFPDYFMKNDDEELKVFGDSTLRFTPEQIIRMADRFYDPKLKPGEKFEYSNTNYILLGMIIEKYSGKPYQQFIQEHILDPLELNDTYFASLRSDKNRAPGHWKTNPSEMPATLAWSAGEIVSTLQDMTKFIRAWDQGALYEDPATMQTLKTDYFNAMGMGMKYGLGLLDLQGNALGHGGQTFGFTSFIGAVPKGYYFAFGCDDASAQSWGPAMLISQILVNE